MKVERKSDAAAYKENERQMKETLKAMKPKRFEVDEVAPDEMTDQGPGRMIETEWGPTLAVPGQKVLTDEGTGKSVAVPNDVYQREYGKAS